MGEILVRCVGVCNTVCFVTKYDHLLKISLSASVYAIKSVFLVGLSYLRFSIHVPVIARNKSSAELVWIAIFFVIKYASRSLCLLQCKVLHTIRYVALLVFDNDHNFLISG